MNFGTGSNFGINIEIQNSNISNNIDSGAGSLGVLDLYSGGSTFTVNIYNSVFYANQGKRKNLDLISFRLIELQFIF